MTESLVDLLLVRLGREEEKRKVLKLLIASLDLSVSEAEKAVNSSPAVIKEAVPMNEARIIQKDLYPYIDLLPRIDDTSFDTSAPSDTELNEAEEFGDIEVEDFGIDEDEEDPVLEEDLPEVGTPSDISDDYEPLVTTSASDEILTVKRCHICGRTPSDDEKLAPCRTCGELTCRNCFDKIAHVCTKCSHEGKAIDRPNEGLEQEKEEERLELDYDELPEEKNREKGQSPVALIVVFLVLAAGGVFYFLDPMGLFSSPPSAGAQSSPSAVVDTLVAEAEDTSAVVSDDSVAVSENIPDSTVSADSLAESVDDPFGVFALTLPEECVHDDNSPEIDYEVRAPSRVGAVIAREESEFLFGQIADIAANIGIELDGGAFLVYHDTTAVLVVALRHPEETEKRLALMRDVAAWLLPSMVDQFVLVYKENPYSDTVCYSLVKEAFPSVQGVMSPGRFQRLLGYREDCIESITGPVATWLSGTR